MKCFPLLLFLFTQGLWANPSAPISKQGADVTGIGSATVTVTATSSTAVITWPNFSVNSGETVEFTSSIPSSTPYYVFNQVSGGPASQINGSIHSTDNGNIYLVNPAGIIVGPTGTIATGAFVASTLDLVGTFNPTAQMEFNVTSSTPIAQRVITNQGNITSFTGDVTIIGYRIVNSGQIGAALTAAEAVGVDIVLQPASTDKVFIQTSSATTAANTIGLNQGGTIQGQAVVMKGDGHAYELAINLTGVVKTTLCTANNGQVIITALPGQSTPPVVPCSGSVQITGQISKASPGGFGPTVSVSAFKIALLPGASIDVSGNNGGGIINLGTLTGSCLTNYVYVDPAASLTNNALTSGNGGTIQVSSVNSLLFSGSIQSQGAGTGSVGGTVIMTAPSLGVNATNINLAGTTVGRSTFNSPSIQVDGPVSVVGLSGVTLFGGQPFPIVALSNIPATALSSILGTSHVTLNATGSPGSITVLNDVTWSSGNNITMNTTSNVASSIQIHAILNMTSASFPTTTIVNLVSPIIQVGSPSAGIILTSGNINIDTASLTVSGGSTPGTISIIDTENGTVTILFSNYIHVYGGSSAGSDAGIKGTTVTIDSKTLGAGSIEVVANDCSKAFIDGKTVNIGTTTKPLSVLVQGGCCSSANEAYIGNPDPHSSQITIVLTGDVTLIGGSGGIGNKASIMSLGGGKTISITANNVNIQGGSGGINNVARIISLGAGGTVNLVIANDLNITGGGSGAQGASASVEGDVVNYTVIRDAHITGGGGQSNSAFLQGYSSLTGLIGRNFTLTAGTASLASAELRSSALIKLDSSSGTSNFTFTAAGTSNRSFARAIILGNGNIQIGQSQSPLNIEFLAGTGGDPHVLVTVTGNGNILVTAKQDILFQGGGQGNSSAGALVVGTGNITFKAGRDLHLFTGTTTTANVFLQTTNGSITTGAGRDTHLVGNCKLPNKAFFLSQGSAGGMFITSPNAVTLREFSYIQLTNPSGNFIVGTGSNSLILPVGTSGQFQINPALLPPNFRIQTQTLVVVDCSSIIIDGHTIIPIAPPTIYPGPGWYKYIFLYEVFYRLNHDRIPRWSLCDSPYFWNDAMYTAP